MLDEARREEIVTCIVCTSEFLIGEKDKYQSLKYFEDSCICNECLRRERHGWPRSK